MVEVRVGDQDEIGARDVGVDGGGVRDEIVVGTTKPERWQQNAASLEAGALPRAEFERIRARWREVAKTSWTGQV